MVDISDPTPNPPQAGETFTVTATNGVAPYTFTWVIGDGDEQSATQDDPEFAISVPAGTSGQDLHLKVKDGNGQRDAESWVIIDKAPVKSP